MKVITTGKKLIFSWCDGIEDSAFEQLVNVANHPKLFHHVAAMSDCHTGYGMPIGGVAGLDGAISPNMVGCDIGCGVIARRLCLKASDLSSIERKGIDERIRDLVPVGLGIVNEISTQVGTTFMDKFRDELMHYGVLQTCDVDYISRSMGTLGSNNHFIELQKDEEDNIWIMIHTGSRKLGNMINNRFHKNGALGLCDMWESRIPDPDLAFLPIGSPGASMYISSMTIALTFAKFSRKIILDRCMQSFEDVIGYYPDVEEAENQPEINAHHNYATVEKHFGKRLWVHRKGAISVSPGEIGIIPGDMKSKSYIVIGVGGKENRDSFHSCSHGAGRAMSRTAANKMISTEEAEASMEGIIHGPFTKTNLRTGLVTKDTSEAHGSYKDIGEVMDQQIGLFNIMHTLSPIINIKG